MEMSQGSPESLGAPVRRVRRESSGFPPREEESRSPHSQQGVGWSPTGSRGQLGLGEPPVLPLQTPWRVDENQEKPRDFHGEIFLLF